jgi:hypothetical protein
VPVLKGSWRERLKSGPLRDVYAFLRSAKRRLRGEPLGGVLSVPLERWSIEAHLPFVARYPDDARLHFSLALAYLERAGAGDLDQARACLHTAGSLDFESPERIALYLALLNARQGDGEAARKLLAELPRYEWTDAEAALLDEAARVPHAELDAAAVGAARHGF